MVVSRLWMMLACIPFSVPVLGQFAGVIPGIKAELHAVSYYVPLGQPVLVRFSIANVTNEPVTLTVPGTEPEIPSPEAGLPLAHVFSGGSSSGVSVMTPSGRRWEEPAGYKVTGRAPILMLAPRSSVGTTLDLRDYFPALRGAGQYRVTWRPYAGGVGNETALITVGPLKRAEIVTDEGTMVIRFLYADAPETVTNFIDLAKTGFYNRSTFHRLEPGHLLQGGCPRGDGTGIRLDGKKIPPEFNSRPMDKGTVAMALLDDDPDSASSQFFICNTRQKKWDGRYTVFGELVGEKSFLTLDRLMATPTDEHGRPIRPLHMHSVRIIDTPPDEVP